MTNLSHTEKERCVMRLLNSGLSFALYRLPQTDEVRLVMQSTGQVRVVGKEELDPKGFIFAPFWETKDCPTLLIEPQVAVRGWDDIARETRQLKEKRGTLAQPNIRVTERRHKAMFQEAMHAITEKQYEKVVIADKLIARGEEMLHGKEERVFCQAVGQFPNSMVYLVYTPIGGLWMGITPEILLESEGDMYRTMALAGTKMDDCEPWDQKNSVEHQSVVHYLEETLTALSTDYHKQGPYTRRAGNLFHLCTDFHFPRQGMLHSMELLRRLHPTPAVCGMPQDEVYRFLKEREKVERNYYSGYLGPINMTDGTHVFVNLRCANIHSRFTAYYAGGGLNQYSEYEKEHEEIERKMNILKQLAHD